MEQKYKKILDQLKQLEKEDRLDVVSVYFGDINGDYEFGNYGDTSDTIDYIITNGKVAVNHYDNGQFYYEVKDADYTFISTLEAAPEGYVPVCSRVDVFFDPDSFDEFQNFMVASHDDLYSKAFPGDAYKGGLGNYKSEERKGFVITPSKELVFKNREDIPSYDDYTVGDPYRGKYHERNRAWKF